MLKIDIKDEEADYVDDISSHEFSNMDEHELSTD